MHHVFMCIYVYITQFIHCQHDTCVDLVKRDDSSTSEFEDLDVVDTTGVTQAKVPDGAYTLVKACSGS